jgi:hypothetical protein
MQNAWSLDRNNLYCVVTALQLVRGSLQKNKFAFISIHINAWIWV